VIPIFNPALGNDSVLDTIEFNTQNVRAAICKLKSNLSSGPDGLPSLLFKRLKHCLAEPLARQFTQLFQGQLSRPIGNMSLRKEQQAVPAITGQHH